MRKCLVWTASLVALLVSAWIFDPFTTHIEEHKARAYLSDMLHGESFVPASLTVLQATRMGGRDHELYFKFKIAPSDVNAMRQRAAEALRIEDPAGFRELTSVAGANAGDTPGWWNPSELPDADYVRSVDTGFIFSVRTGIVYAYKAFI